MTEREQAKESVRFRAAVVTAVLTLGLLGHGVAQTAGTSKTAKSVVDRVASGDSPSNPGPLATDLSPELNRPSIQRALRKVADWQLEVAEPKFNQQWTFAALYDGLIAVSKDTGDTKYEAAVRRAAERFHWQLIDERFPHADDEALGQAYLDLDRDHPDPTHIAATQAVLDRLLSRPDDAAKPLWWWCDALFMAPPVLVRMSAATGDRRYDDLLDREWWITSHELYDPQQHLFFRDARYLTQKEKNGQPLFWARGNGWVLAALANVLTYLPLDDPNRPRYLAQFREMAARVAQLQGADGLWRTGLLDPDAYPQPEVSGSAFFTYAIAWGIDHHILDAAAYRPVVTRSWAAMVKHIYATGRLGSIQPVGAAPDDFPPSSSYVFGVGGFLLAGSELDTMLRDELVSAKSHRRQLQH